MNTDPSFQSKFLNIFKLVLLAATFGFIFYKLVYAYHLHELYEQFHFNLTSGKCLSLLIVCLLSVANWSLESIKWKLLISKNEQFSFRGSVKAVLSGIALGIITPNQLGDFAGRVIHLKTFNKIKGSLVTVIGHTAQVIMTVVFGFFAFIWFLHDQQRIPDPLNILLNCVLTLLVLIAIPAYLNIKMVSRIPFSEKINKYTSVFSLYSRKELSRVLLYALLRYLIFVLQYRLLLYFYDVTITWEQSTAAISATLFAQSFVPSFLLLDLGMRGASALWFFGFYSAQSAGILLAAYSLWTLNIMFPGLAGLLFILKWRKNK